MWEKVEVLISKRVGKWIERIKTDPIPLVCIGLVISNIWLTKQSYEKDEVIKEKDALLYKIQSEKHREDREDNLFWRGAYIELLPYYKALKHEKDSTAIVTPPVSR